MQCCFSCFYWKGIQFKVLFYCYDMLNCKVVNALAALPFLLVACLVACNLISSFASQQFSLMKIHEQ